MTGGPIGLGVGIPLGTARAAVQPTVFAADSAAHVLLMGQSTSAASSVIAGSTPTSFAGGTIVRVAFGLSGGGFMSAEGRSRAHVMFDVTATSALDFRNVPLLAGQAVVRGATTPNFGSAFSVLPPKDAIPDINAGMGQSSFAAGTGRMSAKAGKGPGTIKGGGGKQAIVGGFGQALVRQ